MKTTLKEVFLLEDKEFWQSLGRWADQPGAEEMSDLLKRKPPPRPAPKISKDEAANLVGTLGEISNLSSTIKSEIINWHKNSEPEESRLPDEDTASIIYEYINNLVKKMEILKRF